MALSAAAPSPLAAAACRAAIACIPYVTSSATSGRYSTRYDAFNNKRTSVTYTDRRTTLLSLASDDISAVGQAARSWSPRRRTRGSVAQKGVVGGVGGIG